MDPHNVKRGFWWAHMGWMLFRVPGEKRCTRHTVKGIDIKSAKKLLKSGKLNRPNAKIQ